MSEINACERFCGEPLSNKRAKNCSECMALKNEGNKTGFYNEALKALSEIGATA